MDDSNLWHGWRVAGRYLISPDGQRMTEKRLQGLMFRDASELRLAGFESRRRAEAGRRSPARQFRVKVIIVDLQDYRVGGLAAG